MAFEDFWVSQTQTPVVVGTGLRFNGGQYMQRTNTTNGSTDKWTLSVWLKRGKISAAADYWILGTGVNTTTGWDRTYVFVKNDQVYFSNQDTFFRSSQGVLRDPGAWYHIVSTFDSSLAVANNRWLMYINGVQVPVNNLAAVPLNQTTVVNGNGQPVQIGVADGGGPPWDGYMSDYFLTEKAFLPTTFGQFDANGVWVPLPFATAKANVIAANGFGTNGFALNFDSANFNSGTLVWADQSGNGNNFTASWNCASGAGGGSTGTDIVGDSPTTNYAVINPLYRNSVTSNANLTTGASQGKPSILPGFATSGTVPQTVGVNGAGVSWNGTQSGWSTNSGNISFGQQSTFTSGTKLYAANLNAVTITKGSTGFQAILGAGGGILAAAQAVFPSGLWWIKSRANVDNHQLVTSLLGSGNAMTTPTTVGLQSYAAPSGQSVAWCWPTTGTTVSNTDGTLTSTLDANPGKGFSMATYVGNGTTGTVGHGLGAAPGMVIIALTNTAGLPGGLSSWQIWHSGTPTAPLELNTSGGAGAGLYPLWGSTAPTATVTTVAVDGSSTNTNYNGRTLLMLSWAPITGFSDFGSYNGNTTDGPFVYTGFKPAFVLIKNTSGGDWEIYDNARDTYNPEKSVLQPNQTSAQSNINGIDFLSNGFKIRTTDSNVNANGQSFIYSAFAENPFGGSNVAPVTAR